MKVIHFVAVNVTLVNHVSTNLLTILKEVACYPPIRWIIPWNLKWWLHRRHHDKNDCFYDDESMTRENTVCYWRYQSSEYLDPSIVKADTSCVEQIDKVLQTKKARSIRWMSWRHYQLQLCILHYSLQCTTLISSCKL